MTSAAEDGGSFKMQRVADSRYFTCIRDPTKYGRSRSTLKMEELEPEIFFGGL